MSEALHDADRPTAARARDLTLRFLAWECGHHWTRPDDILVSSPDQATLILRAIACAISQSGSCRAVLMSDERAQAAYVTDDYISIGYGGKSVFDAEHTWDVRPTVIHGTAEETAEIHSDALAAALDSLHGDIARWDGPYTLDFGVVTTVLSPADIEDACAADVDSFCRLPPVYRPASEVLAELREEAAALDFEAAEGEMRALLGESLDLVPRMSDDDPIAPALADWCTRVRVALAKAGGAICTTDVGAPQ